MNRRRNYKIHDFIIKQELLESTIVFY